MLRQRWSCVVWEGKSIWEQRRQVAAGIILVSIFYFLFSDRLLPWHFKFCLCFLRQCLLQSACSVSAVGCRRPWEPPGKGAGALFLAWCAAFSCPPLRVCKCQILICFFFLSWEDLTVTPVLRLLQEELSRPECSALRPAWDTWCSGGCCQW